MKFDLSNFKFDPLNVIETVLWGSETLQKRHNKNLMI